ncbi:MAG: hypothetical protein ACD_79C01047G0003 [uncultured bacterium]|nr:MAG: hypothetical protein ACD_79C01047G0003 [uncultured bacterium]
MLYKYLINDGIVLEPKISNKWLILEQLTGFFCRQLPLSIADQILETVLNREMIVSTGLGGGIAIPHARTDLVQKTELLFARFKSGVEWNSIDGSSVNFLFLVIGPTSSAEEYLFVLSKISKLLSRKQNKDELLHAKSSKEIYMILSSNKDREKTREKHIPSSAAQN